MKLSQGELQTGQLDPKTIDDAVEQVKFNGYSVGRWIPSFRTVTANVWK